MSFVGSFKADHTTATFQTLTQTFAAGEIGPEVWTTSTTASGLFWEGGAVDSVVSERLRASVDANFICDYSETLAAIPDTARAIICGLNYSVVHVDNIGRQNKVLTVMLKKI